MSFTGDVKRELAGVRIKQAEVGFAEAYGLMVFCRKFSPEEISFRTESRSAAERFLQISAEYLGVVSEMTEKLTARKNNPANYRVCIPDVNECGKVFVVFGHYKDDISLRINMSNILYEARMSAFLRGAFLTCGSVSAPETEYRLEFSTVHKNISEDLCRVIEEASESASGRIIKPKVIVRRGSYFVCIKDSEDIADLLTLMGAGGASMAVMQVKIEKNDGNVKNRKSNSFIANADKSLSNAARQIRAIETLEQSGVLDTLSEELQFAAKLRMENPMMSLKELAEVSGMPISKSGLNHRLKRLEQLALETEQINQK